MGVGISGHIEWSGIFGDTDIVVKPACKVTPLQGGALFRCFSTNITLLKSGMGSEYQAA